MQLVIIDPGHFHASLLQKEMYDGLDPRVEVFAPAGPDLEDYIKRVLMFNSRAVNPTHWELEVYRTADPMRDMLRAHRGNIAVFAGRNRAKIDRILAALGAGMHVFADKPWIIDSADVPKLARALDEAARRNLAAYDIMTERFEVTSEAQRELVNDPAVFGSLQQGSGAEPAVVARSVHNIMKVVAGVPLKRPAWFFDIAEYGEALADVGTHVVDLVQWTVHPDKPIDPRRDIEIIGGRRWPLTLTRAQLEQVTGVSSFPASLDYYCNNSVHYTLRGSHVKLEIVWDWQAPEGQGDVYEASFRGTRSRIEIRQGAPEKFTPELYVVPTHADVPAAVRTRIAALQSRWPGIAAIEDRGAIRISIPPKFRVGHEDHFAQVARRFLEYVRSPRSLPSWERSYMLAKYRVSTEGVELSHRPTA